MTFTFKNSTGGSAGSLAPHLLRGCGGCLGGFFCYFFLLYSNDLTCEAFH